MDENKEKVDSFKKIILEYIKVIIITLVVTFTILQFIQISRVYGSSMIPTYHEGNIVIVDKVFYHQPVRNDIVVIDYKTETNETYIIKRVIGVGGDHIDIRDNVVYVNDKKINEDYINESMITDNLSIDVPLGKIFVMGDNRNVSLDSRKLGYFDFKKDVIGKVIWQVPFF